MTQEEPPENLSKKEVWNRLRRLEKLVLPNRRQFVKAAGAAGLGVAFGAGRASAADTSGDRVGGPGEETDVFIDEIKDASGDVVADIDDTGAVDFQRPISTDDIQSTGSQFLRFKEVLNLSDTATTTVLDSGNTLNGVIFVSGAGRSTALIAPDNANNPALLHDPDGKYSLTSGNAGTVNIYWTGSEYVWENQTGGSINLYYLVLKNK